MPTTTLQSLLQKEIKLLNARIDTKIIEGRSYRKEAQTHRLLLAKLEMLKERKHKRISLSTLLAL